MNVKDKYASIRFQDKYHSSWTLNCENVVLLQKICDVIDSCRWAGGKNRQKKLTTYTVNAFTVTTKNISAAQYLLQAHNFEYVLLSIFFQDPLEKFFGQARPRFGRNFYFDEKDVLVAGTVQRLHQIVKHYAMRKDNSNSDPHVPWCSSCEDEPCEEDIDLIESFQISNFT